VTKKPLPTLPILVENAATATFDCVYPTCGGKCCKQGRPPVEPGEIARIEANLTKFLPHLREKARKVIETRGFMTRREKQGMRMMAVSEGWCVFENQGCVLHKVGAKEGDRFKYKPWACATFPLDRLEKTDGWYVRQWKLHGEDWDLFCLNPKESKKPAVSTMQGELEFAARLDSGKEAWRGGSVPKPAKKPKAQKKRSARK
jgi:hypothetical protein